MKQRKTIIVAVGGNFLSNGKSSMDEQLQQAFKAALLVKELLARELNVVIVHGNGPQVGASYLQQLEGHMKGIPVMSLGMCNALTQGQIGTMLELAIRNTVGSSIPDFKIVPLVSQVEVRADDPAFSEPAKPIGCFYLEEELDAIQKDFPHWVMKEDSGRGYRRVVPSPTPVNVLNSDAIPALFGAGFRVVINGGGGGIPVVRDALGKFNPIDAVIDKDWTSCLIGLQIKADHMIIITGGPYACLGFNQLTPGEVAEIGRLSAESAEAAKNYIAQLGKIIPLFNLTTEQANEYLQQGEFAAGSMAPKIAASIRFVTETGGSAFVTDAENAIAALDGGEHQKKGTRIYC